MSLTDEEATLVARLRRRPIITRGDAFVKAAQSKANWDARPDAKVAALVPINLRDLERRGFIEHTPIGDGALRWTACDRPASLEWPHWRCEERCDGLGVSWWIYANLGDHPELRTDMTFTHAMLGDYPRAAVEELADAVRHMQEMIAEAMALRSSGQPCECGGCGSDPVTDAPQVPAHEPRNGQ